jgi:hypothetical protein
MIRNPAKKRHGFGIQGIGLRRICRQTIADLVVNERISVYNVSVMIQTRGDDYDYKRKRAYQGEKECQDF